MKKFIKIISFVLALAMMLSIVACGGSGEDPTSASEATEATEATQAAPAIEGDEFNNASIGTTAAVSSFSDITSQVGIDILKAGGNAIDAAVATILAIGVCEPHHSGLGGSGLMTIYLADEDRYTTIEYLETVPMNVDSSYYNKAQYVKTARCAGVPGQVRGLAYALEKYGTMSWQQVIEPAIKLARDGFVLDSVAAGAIADAYSAFNQEGYEYLYNLFTNDGFPYSAGDTYKNEDLAYTLQELHDKGPEEFYTGAMAQKIADSFKAADAAISMEDLAAYQPREYDPITTTYYGYDVYTVPNPSVGGVLVTEALNNMEEVDIKQYEQGSVDYWKAFNECLRLANSDAYKYGGDPNFYNMPMDIILSKEHAKERTQLINMNACLYPVPQSTETYTKKDAAAPVENEAADANIDEGGCTTHMAVVDKDGNVVSSTNTVGFSWGCYFATEGLGFVYNSHLNNVSWTNPDSPDYFGDKGKMIRSTMSPTIVAKDGKPVLAVGSPGSTVIPPVIVSVINNTLLYDMNVQQAINAPRAFAMDRDTTNGPETILTAEAGRMKETDIRMLEVFGYSFNKVNDYSQTCGGIAAISINPETGELFAGGDPRRTYKGLAY